MGSFEDLARARAGSGGAVSSGGGSFDRLARQRSGGGVVPEVPKSKRKKKDPDFDWLRAVVAGPSLIAEHLADTAPNKYAAAPFRVYSVLGGATTAALHHPGRTITQAQHSITGLPETGAALAHVWKQDYKKSRSYGHADATVLAMLLHSSVKDYKKRYGKNYKEEAQKEPFSNLMDLLTFAGAGTRALALGSAAKRLSEAGADVRPASIWKESSRPGLLSEGAPRDRKVTYQAPGAPKPGEVNLPFSRSPLRRETQMMMDEISQRYPHIPGLGAASRLTRGQGQALQRTVDRLLGSIPGAESLNKIGDAGRTRLWWGTQIGDHSDEALRQMRDVLHEELTTHKPQADAKYNDWLWEAKQAGFGPQLLKRLDEAIKYKPDAHYYKAEQALREATDMSESVISDQNGFSNIEHDIQRADEHAKELEATGASTEAIDAAHEFTQKLMDELDGKGVQLQSMFGSRRNRLREFFDARRHVDNPIRSARLAELSAHPNFGPEKAQWVVNLIDRMANATGDPHGFWETRIGDTPNEPVQQFMQRASDAFFQHASERGMVEGPGGYLGIHGGSVYYSDLQRWLDKQDFKAMKAQSLEAAMKRVLKPMEYYNAGMELFFATRKGEQRIPRKELMEHLSNPLNAYNVTERYLMDDTGLPSRERTVYGSHTTASGHGYMTNSLISRHLENPGEYREIVVTLPSGGRPRNELRRSSEAYQHWKADNVVFHVRFHVFEEDGVKKLLVDEIQSDWEAEFRDQKLKKEDVPAQGSMDEFERDQEIRDLQRQRSDLNDEVSQAVSEMEDAIHSGDRETESQLHTKLYELDDLIQTINGMLEGIKPYTQPSPLGSAYYNAALHRMMREAAEENVAELIIADPRVQHARNFGDEASGYVHPGISEGASPESVMAWFDRNPDPKGMTNWRNLYGEQFPRALEKRYGIRGERVSNAYQGRFTTQLGDSSGQGAMPGTRFRLTPQVKQQAMLPGPLYQRMPNWDAVPKGATEFLADGNRLVHLFKDADISTVIHELSHSAVFDLTGRDRQILEGHYGAGSAIEQWKESAHENYARDFELWMREGHAPNAPLGRVFARIAAWMREIYKTVDEKHEIPQDVKDVFGRMFVNHDDVPDIFIPHRTTKADLGGTRTSRGIPRANREIGDQVKSRVPLFKANKLALVRSGMVDDDPRHLFEHVNRVVMMARANQLRDMVLQMGKPLGPGEYPDFETQYVVKRAGSGVDKPTYDALENADTPELVRQTIKDFVDNSIAQNPAEYEKWLAKRDPNERLYTVDKKSVDSLFKNVTGSTPGATTGPRSGIGHAFDLLQDTARGLLLYGNPGFYIANMVGNAWMSAFADPRALRYLKWGMENAVKDAKGSDSADPLFGKISVEMGRGPTAGQLSSSQSFLGGGAYGTRAADRYSHGLHWWGQRSGRVIDDSFRVGAWRQVARKHGYKSAQEQADLIDAAAGERTKMHLTESKARKDLASIRDEAENLMLDFDSMTPFEKKYLMRSVFLYPFLRASAKYPFMYAGERPVVAGALGTAGTIGTQMADEQLGSREGLPQWAEGYARLGGGQFLNIGSIAPIAPFLGIAESALNVGQPAEIGINRPLSYLNPVRQLMFELGRSQNKYGRDANALEILRQDAPLPGYLAQALGLHHPSAQYSDQSEWAAILRALRIVPFGMTQNAG